jgi:hypothetical protein
LPAKTLRPILWTAAVAAGVALLPGLVLAAGRTLAWRDTARLFAPLRVPVAAALRELHLPLWNPHEGLGVPLFAQMMHAVLHPVSLAAAFLAPGAGMDAIIVAHLLLAGVGAMVLARQLGASPAAAAAGGLGYGLSGYVLGMSAVVQYLGAAATAPWAIAALRAAAGRGRWPLPVAAAAVAALVFAGDPQWATVAVGLGAALALEAGRLAGLVRAALAAATGAALAAVQLVPTWAYFRETVRSAGLDAEDRLQWALAPWRLLELVAPGFFGGRPGPAQAPVFLLLGGPTRYPLPFAPSVFAGAALLVIAAWGARASRPARLLAGASILFLWLALGPWLGADQTLGAVPVWGSFRYAEKLVGPLTLCLAVLAALGADRIAASQPPRPSPAAAVAAVSAALAAALAAWPGSDDLAVARERLAVGLAHAAIGLGLLAAALRAAARPAWRHRFPALAAGLVFLQSAAAAPFALHAGARDACEERPLQALRTPGTIPRVAVPLDAVLSLGPQALDEWDRMIAIQSRLGEPPYNVPSGVDQVSTYTGLVPRRYARVEQGLARDFGPERWIAWRRFGLTHVVLDRVAEVDPRQWQAAEAACAGGQLVLRDPEWGFTICQVPSRPWALFAEGAVEATEADAYPRLAGALDAGSPAVVLEGRAAGPLAPGRILSAERQEERVRIEAESSGDGLLVVNDAYWPGWEATLDGRHVPILAADALVRAVAWPAGRHVLEMRYRPPNVRLGLAGSAAGLAALLGLLLATPRARREPAAADPPQAPGYPP